MTFSSKSKDALRTRLASGISTRRIGELKQQHALQWIYLFGWSWPSVLEQICGCKNKRLTSQLLKKKLITTMVPEAAGMKGVPKKIIVLSERGLQEVERFQKELIKYELDPSRIRQTHIRHAAIAQQETANMLGPNFGFQTERQLAAMSVKNMKQPDILWIIDGKRIAVEIELTSKWDRGFDQFVLSTILSLMASAQTPARFDSVLILTDSPATQERYSAQFKPGQTFNAWEKEGSKNTGKWKVSNQQYKVPHEIDGKVVCQLLD
jgi:hypothetical protein